MVDCLSLLRTYNINRKEIVERDDFIIFDQSAFPRSTKTNYQIFKAVVDKTPKDYYTLETLLFLLKHASMIHAHYLPKANNAKIPPIRFPDRRSLLNYLNGDIDTAPGIDKNGPMDMPVSPPSLKRSLGVTGIDEPIHRPRHDDQKKKRPATNEHIVLKLIPEDQVFGFNLNCIKFAFNIVSYQETLASQNRV
ncbi:Parafibromin-like [Oopsacas minuta]|uniref:Parafibromin-like n=1 Tax=Oopsacas minuta TaxID=111878 RepID=A0AAV7JZR0_9METZ|nr:Parafibromin-like [Oopsacas minuta]